MTLHGEINNETFQTAVEKKMSFYDLLIVDPEEAYSVSRSVFPSGSNIRVSRHEEDESSHERRAGAEVGVGVFPANASMGGNFKRETSDHTESTVEAQTNRTVVVVKINGGSNGAGCMGCSKTVLKISLLLKPSATPEPQTPLAPHSSMRNEPIEGENTEGAPPQIPVDKVSHLHPFRRTSPSGRGKISPPVELAAKKSPRSETKSPPVRPAFKV